MSDENKEKASELLIEEKEKNLSPEIEKNNGGDKAVNSFESNETSEIEKLKQELAKAKALLNSLGISDEEYIQDLTRKEQLAKLYNLEVKRLEQVALNDLSKIAELYKQGKIKPEQVRSLKEVVSARLNEEKAKLASKFEIYGNKLAEKINAMVLEKFNAKKPGYLDAPERAEVLEYIKQSTGIVSPVQLEKVMELVEKVENAAINRYLQEKEASETLMQENLNAKARLNTAVDSLSGGNVSHKKLFTREEIRKMSNKEFEKYEKQIMEQIKAGKL